ncbi:MAG: hypothetical protein KKH68_07220 [Proteobacteria bacterium]|nr:hypothetical protein [Pseudomonadota bacterium]
MKEKKSKSQVDLEWEQRILCIDESCIGVVGPDGCCKECGLPCASGQAHEGVQSSFDKIAAETATTDLEYAETDEAAAEDFEDDEAEADSDPEWEQRTLCSDESCIGVVGPDGCCKECGLPYAPDSSS